MKRIYMILMVILSVVLAASVMALNVPGISIPSGQTRDVKGQFIVRFSDDAAISGIQRAFGMVRLGVPSVETVLDNYQTQEVRPLFPDHKNDPGIMSRFYVVRIPKDQDDQAFMDAMLADPHIVAIERDKECPVALSPNDPEHWRQWATYVSSPAQVHSAWDIETGSDTAIIAFIDTGVLYNHPDLIQNIWVNPGEDMNGDRVVFDSTDFNGVDNDGNGYVDDVVGYDFFSGGSESPWPGENVGPDNNPKDFNGHGTNCAGIATASTNNALGGSGMAGGWGPLYGDRGARIMCLRAGYSAVDPNTGQEVGYLIMSAVIEAINYAVNNHADVISYSAGSSAVLGMSTALEAAMSAGIVFCNAAGNDNTSSSPSYFSLYPGILTVAATNSSDQKSSYSNYGSWVEVSAPGDNIYNTYSYHYSATYAYLSGTSMATPMVSGLAALIKSHYPSFNKTQIDTIITHNADNIDAQNPYYVGMLGSGRINAYKSLQYAPVAKFTSDVRIGPAPLTVNFTDQSPSPTSWSWAFGDGGTSPDQNPSYVYNNPGLYDVALTVTDPNGTTTKTRKYYVLATGDTLYGNAVISHADMSFAVPIRLKNTVRLDEIDLVITFPHTSTLTLVIDSVTSLGTRADSYVQIPSGATDMAAILIIPAPTTAKSPLAPGDGPIVNVWFSAIGYGVTKIDTSSFSTYSNIVKSRFGNYVPAVKSFTVSIRRRGDANNDGTVNVADVVYIINYVFKKGPAPNSYLGDANGDTNINVADAVYLINFIFKGGTPPPL